MRVNTRDAPAAISASGAVEASPPEAKPKTVAPAATPAVTPATVSSTTAPPPGSTPRPAAAAR